jgi:peptidoglycan/LPS O-acetylase OafA/YrhL
MSFRTDVLPSRALKVMGPRAARKKTGIRKDIQGLRAVAVMVVVMDHMIKWPTGGYIGVDVFFVISGFLITGLLLREHERTGRISFADFYRRRLRRIMPVAVIVLVAATGASMLLHGIGRTATLLDDVVYSLFFVANWRFAATGTDYMQALGPVSPVQHYWSLAVEEQFYLIWPVLLVLVLGWVAKRFRMSPRRAVRILRLAVVGLIGVSFGYACWQSTAEPTWAYFSTFSRGWELGIGALLATLAGRMAQMPDSVRPVIAWLGLGGIVCSVGILNSGSVFPAPWGAAPVLATSLVIAAGTGATSRRTPRLLSCRPMQYAGMISYSLYLWHFPVIVMFQALSPQPQSVFVILAQCALILGLSIASFHLVEDPIRKSKWLESSRHSGVNRADAASGLRGWAKIVLVGVGPAVVALIATSVLAGVVASRSQARIESAQTLEVDPAKRAQQMKSSLDATSWPTVTPAIENLGPKSWVPEWRDDLCQDVWEPDLSRCVYGNPDGAKTVVLIGDSIAISYMPALRAAFEKEGWKLQSLTLQQCPAIDISVFKDGSTGGVAPPYPECDRHHDWVRNYLAKLRPDLVVMSSVQETIFRLANGAKGDDAIRDWSNATTDTLTRLAPLAKQVVLLGPPPRGINLQACATTLSTPQDCIATRTAERAKMQAAEFAAVPDLPNVTAVDTTSWFCGEENRCPSFVGTTVMFADGGHLTEAYSKMLGPVLRSVLVGK